MTCLQHKEVTRKSRITKNKQYVMTKLPASWKWCVIEGSLAGIRMPTLWDTNLQRDEGYNFILLTTKVCCSVFW